MTRTRSPSAVELEHRREYTVENVQVPRARVEFRILGVLYAQVLDVDLPELYPRVRRVHPEDLVGVIIGDVEKTVLGVVRQARRLASEAAHAVRVDVSAVRSDREQVRLAEEGALVVLRVRDEEDKVETGHVRNTRGIATAESVFERSIGWRRVWCSTDSCTGGGGGALSLSLIVTPTVAVRPV